ncbi:WXG100 family type VII secretion target [Demequina sp. NBRC 110053]|uniref:WXG100 family type VII secretion target n=1 Tax=Demequina sp. NBRC 110053 TaxID=1570342 RepID=UPI000A00061C|nr:WXG100 family type VII secretion target [Demequina sp. NBRC 110053]
MGQFYVSTGQVATTADALQSLLAQFDAQMEAANADVTGVVGASWTGASSDAFASEWQAFVADAGVTRAALASLIARMRAADTSYEATDASRSGAARTAATQVGSMMRAPSARAGGRSAGVERAS